MGWELMASMEVKFGCACIVRDIFYAYKTRDGHLQLS